MGLIHLALKIVFVLRWLTSSTSWRWTALSGLKVVGIPGSIKLKVLCLTCELLEKASVQ